MKSLQLKFLFEHYCNEWSPNRHKNFFFSDLTTSYLFKNKWELALSILNIFNEKRYTYFIDNELSVVSRDYAIRPRNILLRLTGRF